MSAEVINVTMENAAASIINPPTFTPLKDIFITVIL